MRESFWLSGKAYLQKNVVSLRTFQSPPAITQGHVLVWVVGTFDYITAARHVKLTVRGAVDLVGVVTTVVLLVALEGAVYALSVRAVERA